MPRERKSKTRAELIEDLERLRRRVEELEGEGSGIERKEFDRICETLTNEIEEHEQKEELLQRQNELLESIYANIHVLIAFMDPQFRFIRVNRVYASHGGHPPEYFIGKNHFDLFPSPEDEAIFRQVADTGQAYYAFERPFEDASRPDKGVTYWDWTLHPVTGEEDRVTGLVLSLIDVTDRVMAQQELSRYAERLELSNRELEDFAFVASHDLQEPLRKIQAFGSRLSMKFPDALGVDGTDYLERMLGASARMQAMLDALLSYSRVTTKGRAFTRVSVGDAVREALSNLEALLEAEKGEVDVGDLPLIDADPYQMVQLFQNLIGNAVKFRREDGRPFVRIRAGTGESAEKAREDGFCRITLEDNGIGFDREHLERIFMPFQRLHGRAEYQGAGMGLAICRKIVERHGGTITAESEPGQGSTFIVTLPVRQDSEKEGG